MSQVMGRATSESAASRTDRRPKVLLIVGSGRSGSTLLERALGEVAGVAALGEVVHLWDRAVRDDELCACGSAFGTCPFWSAVGLRAFGGWHRVDADAAVHRRHEVVRTRRVPELLTTSASREWRSERDRLADDLGAIMSAARDESGARMIVDSSKMPAYAALMMRAEVDLRCLQVVRDPRGVANSMRKAVARPEAASGDDLMHRTGVVQSALWWSAFDLVSGLLSTIGTAPFATVRYEDFAADPLATVRHALDFADMPVADSDLAHIAGDRIELGPNHQVAGNPVRFRTGEVTLRRDDAWHEQLTARERRTVGLLTAGMRHRYHYR